LGLDRTRWPGLLVGLERVEVLEVARASGGRLHVAIETTDRLAGCPGCGCRARVRSWRKELLAGGASEVTVAKAYRLLKAVLNTAVDDELIQRNPCRIRGAASEPSP
jgi:hypothetical protein